MRKNIAKKLCACMLAAISFSAVGFLSGCDSAWGSSSGKDGETATIRVAYAEDKILQSYDGSSTLQAMGKLYDGYMMDEFSMSAVRNEYESRQIVITPTKNISSFDVSVGDFKCGGEVLDKENFEIGYEYYHEVTGVFGAKNPMEPGMYPDAVLPMATAKEYGLNKIAANNNQAILITVKVPKTQAAGVYSGTITIDLDGEKLEKSATIEVVDYTLSDTVTVKSCMPFNASYLMFLEGEETQERYEILCAQLNEFRLSAQYLYGMTVGTASTDTLRQMAEAEAEVMLKAAQDPAVPCYSIRTNGLTVSTNTLPANVQEKLTKSTAVVLKEENLKIYMQTFIDKSIETGVDLLKKAYVYMGSIIDEPEGNNTQALVDYVCQQFNNVLAEMAEYARAQGGSEELAESILGVNNVVTTWNSGNYDLVDTYCPEPQYYDSTATLEKYYEHRENGGDYWWYTCLNPDPPYPTIRIDDNGVSARAMYWMMKEYDISGYLTWETIDPSDNFPGYGTYLHGIEHYEDVMRNNADVGDGYYFYPGKIFGLETSVPAIRLYYMRDGGEDYDAIYDLENRLYKALGDAYGAAISPDSVMNEVYGSLYGLNQAYCTSAELGKAKSALNTLLAWAEDGIAISDYAIHSNGKITAKVYAPSGVEVKLNGKKLAGAPSSKGIVYSVNIEAGEFNLAIDGRTLTLGSSFEEISTPEASRFTFEDENQNVLDGIQVLANKYEGLVDTIQIQATAEVGAMLYSLDNGSLTANTDSLLIYCYLDSAANIKTTVEVYNGRITRSLDTVNLKPGYNVLRFDRIGDLDWKSLTSAKSLVFTFTKPDNVTEFTLDIEKLAILK